MPNHIAALDKKITALSDALAHLGKGTDLKELLRIIKFPGWTTPAEFAFAMAILDSMHEQVNQLNRMSTGLLEASKQVSAKKVAEHMV
ncbi:MAG TPA: hypothetical protein VGQ93_17675 [Lysobacter sp.]|nr:hypothetical protein [Lysobacter sp.]